MSQYTPTNPDLPSAPTPSTPSWSPPPAPPEPEPRRRRTGLIAGAVVAVLALVVGAVALVTTQGGESANAQPLALSFTEGQTETYAIHMTMDGQMSSDLIGDMPLLMDMSQVQSWTVRSIDRDGVATIEVTTSELSGFVNGVALPQTSVPPLEIEVAPDGRVISAGGLALGGAGQTQGFGFPGSSQLTPILPDEGDRVAPGDSWEKDFSQEFPFGEGAIEYTASSTYERNADVNGRQAAVIVTEMVVPMDFTLRFDELISALGEEALVPGGPTDLDSLGDATIAYGGQGEFTQTSFVDLDAKELLRTHGAGDFEISMEFAGIPGFSGAIDFSGSFTQELERR
jgi:hypothetical protein